MKVLNIYSSNTGNTEKVAKRISETVEMLNFEINGCKTQTVAGGHPHTAVESPGRAVNREGKRVNVGVCNNAAAFIGPFITPVGDRKKKADIKEGNK